MESNTTTTHTANTEEAMTNLIGRTYNDTTTDAEFDNACDVAIADALDAGTDIWDKIIAYFDEEPDDIDGFNAAVEAKIAEWS